MNLENVLDNDHNKLIFLKAIMLGITYGSSDKKNYYIENIESEIKKIVDKMNKVDVKVNNIVPEKNILTQKTEQKIFFLENQKKSILSLINQLSSNNYGFNYSRINLLICNLTLLNAEIEKNKLIIKKNKEEDDAKQSSQKKIKPSLKNTKKINSVQPIVQNRPQNKENLVGELEKTLGSLSNMIIN